jgi:hypothetical protein
MTHAEEIFRAVVRLTQVQGREEFSRLDVRRQLRVESDTWLNGYTAIFQGMRADHPGGAPGVGEEFAGVFRRVGHGRYVLTEKGQSLLRLLRP